MELENFKKDIINVINTSGLSIGEAYYVLKDVINSVENTYKEYLRTATNQLGTIQTKQEKEEKGE